ncbi:MAG: helix-turn-helix transcriptional regulator [Lachnospiraceae bacterium]|nr:helix-turn-helix transcriptional regulator [Lachnospiraceae bacterium]
MSIKYKFDVLGALKAAGYTSYRLRRERIFGERVIQQLRDGEVVSWKTIDTLCTLLNCQPGDIVEHTPDSETEVQ